MTHATSTSRLAKKSLLAAVLVVAGTAGWFLTGRDELTPIATVATATPAAAGQSTDAALTEGSRAEAAILGWLGAPAGARFRHRLDDRTAVAIAHPESGSHEAGGLHVTCCVETTVLARKGDEAPCSSSASTPCASSAPTAATCRPMRSRTACAAAATSVLVRIDSNGAVLGYGFADDLDGDQHNFLRGLLGVLAFRARPQPR
ncbi:MAG: hypothetical protein U1E73_04800 [Planctomycetota bacterium]